jgi:(p)ppGpp synthase/HD superfamily hydrolase
MEKILEQIKTFADRAHGIQLRKYSPDKYIVHPVRVMETCRIYLPTLPVLAAALLHDVLEDTSTTKEQIHDFLLTLMSKEEAEATLELVIELTDVYTKSGYPTLNRRQRKAKERDRMGQVSPEAQTIKYADIMDNVKEISHQDVDFAPVYIRESKLLLEKMTKGNPVLYLQVLQLIQDEEAVLANL